MSDEKILTTREVAAKLKLSPKELRARLRSMGKGAKGERYEFHEKDVPKLATAIKEHESKQTAKKAAK